MEKVVIFGGKGYIAHHLLSLYPHAILPSCNIADAAKVADVLDAYAPSLVINAAGKTGRPNVDWCEEHKLETIASNVTGPLILLQECAKRSIYWVHIGSGCIYEGQKDGAGWTEEDMPNFYGSFYSRSKAWIDQILRDFPVLQLRLRMPFDGSRHERSLLSKLRKYSRVLDTQNSLTYIPDFLRAAATLIEKKKTGIYNIVNPGVISPWEIMNVYKEMVDPAHAFERLSISSLSDVVKSGRSNCILSNQKLSREGITLLDVRDAIKLAMTDCYLTNQQKVK